MATSAKSKAMAAPAEKTHKTAARKSPQSAGALRLAAWTPGAVEEPAAAFGSAAGISADGGRPLDPRTLLAMETRLGHDFGRVRIHTGPAADRAADGLGAHAYTLGLDVFFQANRFKPDDPAGRALLIHELEHVVRAGPRGPAVPKLQPDPTADDRTKLEAILKQTKNRDKDFLSYLAAHPQSITVAEDLLTSPAVASKTALAVLAVLFKKDPASEERVAIRLQGKTVPLRRNASVATRTMWDNYESAAYANAWLEWAAKRLGEERKKRPGGAKGKPTAMELQYESWKTELRSRLDKLKADRAGLLAAANSAVTSMMDAARPVSYVQRDMLDHLSDMTFGATTDAHWTRLETYDDRTMLALKKEPGVDRQLQLAKTELDQAQKAEQKLGAERKKLETPPAGEKPADARRRESQLGRIKGQETQASRRTKKAERSLTPEGAADPAVREYLESQVPATRAAAEARVAAATMPMLTKVSPFAPVTQLPGTNAYMNLITTDDFWWVYHRALNGIEFGFPDFTAELTTKILVDQRSAVAENRQALGLAVAANFTTYPQHGPGQYDIHAPAGQDIVAAMPDQIDLATVFDGRGAKTKRLFQHVSSQARTDAFDANTGNDDVLAKLVHGYFGFHQTDRKLMAAYLDGTGSIQPNPDASRILGALIIDNVIAGAPPSPDVAAARTAIRAALETSLHAELRTLAKPIDIPDNVDILKTIDGGSGWFGGNVVTPAALDEIRKARGKGVSPEAATAIVFEVTRKIVRNDASVSDPIKALMVTLFSKGIGNRSGPWVTLTHRYKEVGGSREAWIEVDYRHLHGVAMRGDGAIKAGDPVGQVGSSGNAVSPHIHMAIRIYKQNPRGKRNVRYELIVPDDFFPIGRKGRKP